MSYGEREKFYKTLAWQECRNGYLKSVGGLCEKCREQGMITPAEIIHHKIHLTAENVHDPNVSLNWGNLQALCRVHHAEAHGKVKRFDVAEDGTIIPRQ